MISKNVLKFLESLSFLAKERGYFTRVTIDDSSKFVTVMLSTKLKLLGTWL